jgi:hypothetical protein
MSAEKIVGERTRKILEDLAERMIPSGGLDYPGARDIGLVDKLLARAGRYRFEVFALKAMAWLWEISPLFHLKFKLLSQMNPQEQIQYFEGWENSRFMVKRYILIGLKAPFMAVFYNEPAIWEKIGFAPGNCYEKVGEAKK